MARGDGTGPAGAGRMSGRAGGYCAGYGVPGFANPLPRRGLGRGGLSGRGLGRGIGFGWGRGPGQWPHGAVNYDLPYAAPPVAEPTQAQELEQLKAQAKFFQTALEEIGKRIQDLDSETE